MSGFRSRGASDAEEKIPVSAQLEAYLVVDCPLLHIIPAASLHARRQQYSEGLWGVEKAVCPQCRQPISKTRQLSDGFFAFEQDARGSFTNLPLAGSLLNPTTFPSPTPTPVPSPGIPTYRPSRFDAGGSNSIQSTPSNSSMSPPPRWTNSPMKAIQDLAPGPDFQEYSPDLPEVFTEEDRQAAEQARAVPASRPSRWGDFFKRSSVSKEKPVNAVKPSTGAKSISSHDSIGSQLPKIMSFCFSATGRNLLLWKKESEVLVRIELESLGGRAIDLGDLLPETQGKREVHIRHVVEGNEVIAVVLSHNNDLMLLVLHESGLASHTSVRHLNTQHLPTCLAISPDNSYVAVGLGPQVLLLHYAGFNRQGGITLTVPDFPHMGSVKFQTCSFAPDSSTLVVSTQRNDPRRSINDDAVSTYVWACQPIPGDPTRLWMVKMPTDTKGLTTVQYHSSLSLGFVGGMTSTPYSMFISAASRPIPQTASKIFEYRIRCSCFCPPPNSHILYFMDVQNKIFRADLRTLVIKQVADVNTNRGALKPMEEHAILGATADGRLRIFWRQGPGLWSLDVREGSSPVKQNLRTIWQDAIGG